MKSWNPWHGCRKYSEGCANCYMFVLDRAHKVPEQSMAITCVGCTSCGRCKEVDLIELEEIWKEENIK